MDKTSLILVMAVLLVVFIILVFLYVWLGRVKQAGTLSTESIVTFPMLCGVIKNRSATNGELNRAVDTILERFSHVNDGEQAFGVYAELLERLCLHDNTDSKLILRFEKGIRTANPRFKEEIEKALKIGLSERDKR